MPPRRRHGRRSGRREAVGDDVPRDGLGDFVGDRHGPLCVQLLHRRCTEWVTSGRGVGQQSTRLVTLPRAPPRGAQQVQRNRADPEAACVHGRRTTAANTDTRPGARPGTRPRCRVAGPSACGGARLFRGSSPGKRWAPIRRNWLLRATAQRRRPRRRALLTRSWRRRSEDGGLHGGDGGVEVPKVRVDALLQLLLCLAHAPLGAGYRALGVLAHGRR
mmetsp:Transcript_121247/g.387428  ORF Transcript_121247/g.387428 Transcript_121247/m.387428 type:complete len:218 (-) Transcript_121247:1883-2536(-)